MMEEEPPPLGALTQVKATAGILCRSFHFPRITKQTLSVDVVSWILNLLHLSAGPHCGSNKDVTSYVNCQVQGDEQHENDSEFGRFH